MYACGCGVAIQADDLHVVDAEFMVILGGDVCRITPDEVLLDGAGTVMIADTVVDGKADGAQYVTGDGVIFGACGVGHDVAGVEDEIHMEGDGVDVLDELGDGGARGVIHMLSGEGGVGVDVGVTDMDEGEARVFQVRILFEFSVVSFQLSVDSC